MAGGKLTPRQKMINMMYLVLTALLALNVTNEVLNAFHLVNEGLQSSNGSLTSKNADIYKAFEKQRADDPKKAQALYDRAQLAKTYAQILNDSLAAYKVAVIKEAEGVIPPGEAEEGDIKRRDDIDIATRMFVEEGAGVKRGKGLQKLINDTRAKLLGLVDDKDRANFKISLDAPDPKPEGGEKLAWEFKTFNHTPATAALTILSKFQNDDISSEGSVIEYLIKKIGATDFKFTDLQAKVIAPTSYVLDGQQYKADIFLAAFNAGSNPEIFEGPIGGFKKNTDGTYDAVLSDNPLPPGFSSTPMKAENGFGKKEAMGAGVGEKTYGGIIRVKDPATGKFKFYPFEGKYSTAPKAVVVSPTKMNVFYSGVDNPVDISVPGVGQNDVIATIEGGGGALKKDPANPASYIATVSIQGKCNVNVSAKIDGKVQSMGSKEFRVKRIPNPTPMTTGGMEGGNVQAANFKTQQGIKAMLKDFEFDAHFSILSYKFILSGW
jgi:gliding motility-associated protein GldM